MDQVKLKWMLDPPTLTPDTIFGKTLGFFFFSFPLRYSSAGLIEK